MLEEIDSLRQSNKQLAQHVSFLSKELASTKRLREESEVQLSLAKKEVEASAAAQALLDDEVMRKDKQLDAARSVAHRPPSEHTTTPPQGLTHGDVEIIRGLPAAFSDILRKIAAASVAVTSTVRPLVSGSLLPQTLVLWDIENVGIPPSTTTAAVGEMFAKLLDVLASRCTIPADSAIDFVAAHNPRSREGVDSFYVSSNVATTLTRRGVQLFDVGNKAGAADALLIRYLDKWLAATSGCTQRAVVFITGDGGFAPEAAKAKTAGCTTAVIYCAHSADHGALLPSFESARRIEWGEVVGEEVAAQLAERQRRTNEQQLRVHAALSSKPPGSNPRPELNKTALCMYHLHDVECIWTSTYGKCWFAHGMHELLPKPAE